MPQFVAAIPAFFSSAASAVGSAASGVAGALGLGSAGSLATSILGGTATAFSALAQLRAGREQADSLRRQAADATFEATQEEILGQRREVGLKDELTSSLGSISAAYAAAGIDLSYGAAETARGRAESKFDQEITLDRATTDMRKSRLYQRANSYLTMARQAKSSSVLQAAATAAGGAFRIANRG
jgi:hypothetical protein